MNGDGTDRMTILPLERHGTTGASEPLAWSPDGRWLLVKPMTTNHFLIADTRGERAPVDLGQTFKLATGAWSPDGTLLALLRSGAPDVDVKIELMTPTGGRQKVISLVATTSDPRFAPDSKRLTYVSSVASTGSHSLYVTDIAPGGASSLLAKGKGKMSIASAGVLR